MNATFNPYSGATIAAANTMGSNFVETASVGTDTNNNLGFIHVKVTNAAGSTKAGETLKIKYAFSPFTGLTSASINNLRGVAKEMVVALPGATGAINYNVSPPIPISGDSLYTWLEHEDWGITRTLDVKVTCLSNGIPPI